MSMYKILCVAVLLVGILAVAGHKSSATQATGLTTPQIVASGKLLNQSAPFTKTIYTPGVSGVYRLSVYATMTTAVASGNSYWQYSFSWTDVSGQPQNASPVLYSNSELYLGELVHATSYALGGATRTFQANKGMPITQSMSSIGAVDGSVYSVDYTLERLE